MADPHALARDEDQPSEDELVVLLLLRASGLKQKCGHTDSSRSSVPKRNACDTRADHGPRCSFATSRSGKRRHMAGRSIAYPGGAGRPRSSR